MKKIFAATLMALTMLAAHAVTFNGNHYEGIAKLAGQPIDFWTVTNMDDEDIQINLGEAFKFMAGYTAKTVGQTTTLTLKAPGGGTGSLKTADNGESLEGSISINGQSFKLWLLKVPKKKAASTLSADELAATVGSPDGYTAFVRVSMPNGGKMSATSDFSLNAGSKTFKMTCDSPAMQKIFGTMQGSYSIEGDKIVMHDSAGKTVTGTIYNDGTYIEVPMGSAQGMTLDLILIR